MIFWKMCRHSFCETTELHDAISWQHRGDVKPDMLWVSGRGGWVNPLGWGGGTYYLKCKFRSEPGPKTCFCSFPLAMLVGSDKYTLTQSARVKPLIFYENTTVSNGWSNDPLTNEPSSSCRNTKHTHTLCIRLLCCVNRVIKKNDGTSRKQRKKRTTELHVRLRIGLLPVCDRYFLAWGLSGLTVTGHPCIFCRPWPGIKNYVRRQSAKNSHVCNAVTRKTNSQCLTLATKESHAQSPRKLSCLFWSQECGRPRQT